MRKRVSQKHVGFDPEAVLELIRGEIARGHFPETLLLGADEGEDYLRQLTEPHQPQMRRDYFHGVRVLVKTECQGMALVGDKGAWEG